MSIRIPIRLVIPVVLCAGALAGGCVAGATDEGGTGERRSQEVLIVDEEKGTFGGGLRLGDSRAQVRRRSGPASCDEGSSIAPLGKDYYEIGGRYAGDYLPRDRDGPFTQCVMRYRHLAVTVFLPDGAISFVTTDPRARTRRGVGIGDSADLVKRRYPGANCQGKSSGGEAQAGGCLLPAAESSDGVAPPRLSFGLDKAGEEVRSIYLEAPSWQSIKRLRRR